MASSFGGTIKLEGESEYRKALKEITSDLKLMSSELKLTTTQFSTGDKTVKETKTSYDNMNKSVKDQKDKVESLRETLSKMEKEYGSNNEKVVDFKTKLNNAENQLKQMEDATDKSTKELKQMKEGFDDAGNSGLKFGDIIKANLISDAIKFGIKSVADGIKNLASNLDEWSSHSSMVKEQEAKLTQVMKNTTGATDEEIQAIIDLADAKEKLGVVSTETQLAGLQELGTYVENKESLEALLPVMNDMIAQQYGVGASMESASGIATMMGKVLGNGQVDALSRLGYKFDETQKEILKFGTEEERVKTLTEVITQSVGGMNEALAQTDAGKMELASAYIGELQDTVGEAFQSIKTSIVADFLPSIMEVSSALKNMVSGDISIEEGMNKIKNGLLSGVKKMKEVLPQLVDTGMMILSKLLDGITSMLPEILPVVMEVITIITTKLIEMLPEILQAGITILLELVKGISQSLPELIPVAVQCVLDLVETLLDNIDLVIDAALQLIVGLTEGLIEALPILIEKTPIIIEKLVSKLTDPEMLGKIVQTAGKLIGELAVGLVKAIPQLISKIPQIISSLVNGFNNLMSSIKDVGKNLVKGIWEGISGSLDWIKDKIKGWVGNVTKFIKKLFGINSPSKLFKEEIGTNLALGIGEGFGDAMKDVSSEMADAIPTEFDTNINANYGTSTGTLINGFNYDNVVSAFKEALKDTKVVMNGREMGAFITETVSEVVYS